MNIGWLLFGFDGRINRAKCWLVLCASLAVMTAFLLAANLLFRTGAGDTSLVLGDLIQISGRPAGDPLSWALTLLIHIPLLWCIAATSIKRLHDRGKSGWWLLPMGGLPMLIKKLDGVFAGTPLNGPAETLGAALLLWFFVEIYCLRGTRGPNRYGPDLLPKTRRGAIFA